MGKKAKTQRVTEDSTSSFEQSLQRLDEIVHQLEEGQLGLGDSLERYEEAVGHLKHCQKALETAERKIELLAGVDAEGNPVTEPFDDREMTLDEKAASRSRRRSRTSASEGGDADQGTAGGTLF